MPTQEEMNLLGQGSYGCVYKPGITCDGKKSTQKYITKVQEEEHATYNEINIGKKVMKIPNYGRYFSPIIETCPLNVSHIDESEMNKCLIYDKTTKFTTNKMKYVGENTLYSGLKKLANTYPKLFIRLIINSSMDVYKQFQLLNDNKIIHMDVKQDNIVLKDTSNKPIIIDFGLSFDTNEFNASDVFFVYGYDYSPWCIDITMISYMVNKKGTSMTKWEDTLLTKEDVNRVMTDFENENPLMRSLNQKPNTLKNYKEKCAEYFQAYVGKKCEELYKELMKNVNTWDIYAVSAMYYRIIHHYKLDVEMSEFVSILEEQIYSHPSERKDGKEMRSEIKELYDLTSLKDSKKKVSKKLKTISQKEKIKVKAKVQEEYVKEKQDSKKHYEKYLEKVSKK